MGPGAANHLEHLGTRGLQIQCNPVIGSPPRVEGEGILVLLGDPCLPTGGGPGAYRYAVRAQRGGQVATKNLEVFGTGEFQVICIIGILSHLSIPDEPKSSLVG